MDPRAGFGWSELSAADPDVAVRFFGRFLGWERDRHGLAGRTQPIEYSLLTCRGRNVAGLYPMVAAQRKRGVASQWLSYLFVADVDACAQQARALGAELLAAPREVFQLGRMAIVRDPQGALLGLWQARHLGSEFQARGEAGFVSWQEHVSDDVPGAARFYAELCGWQARALPGTGRSLLEGAGGPLAGLSSADLPGGHLAPQWLTFLRVADCAAACDELVRLGASLILPPQGAPEAGVFAVARDPQGAAFGLLTPGAGG
ncbi:MAG TPA: VOC family protein [Planctomycetota bacterium]